MLVRSIHMLLVALLAIATALCAEPPAAWSAGHARVEVQHESEGSETHGSDGAATLAARGRIARHPAASLDGWAGGSLNERPAATLSAGRAYAAFAARVPLDSIIPLRC